MSKNRPEPERHISYRSRTVERTCLTKCVNISTPLAQACTARPVPFARAAVQPGKQVDHHPKLDRHTEFWFPQRTLPRHMHGPLLSRLLSPMGDLDHPARDGSTLPTSPWS